MEDLCKKLEKAAAVGDLDQVIHATVLLENQCDDPNKFRRELAWSAVASAATSGQIAVLRYLLRTKFTIHGSKYSLGHHVATEKAALAKQYRIVKWLIVVEHVNLDLFCCGHIWTDDRGVHYHEGDVEQYADDIRDWITEENELK